MGRLFLAHVGALTILGLAMLLMLKRPPLTAQVQTVRDSPTFEVASVKPNKIGQGSFVPVVQPGGRFTMTNRTLRALIQFAYSPLQAPLHDSQISGGPNWIDADRFDIVAKMEGNPPAGPETADRARLMLRTLLAERFALRVHTETRDVSVYALVTARNDRRLGERLERSEVDCARIPAAPPGVPDPKGPLSPCGFMLRGPGLLRFRGVSMTALARFGFSPSVGRVVVDSTGLEGDFDLDFTWTPAPGEPGVPPPRGVLGPNDTDGTDPNGPSLFTAVQEQLGLKLEPQKGPVEILVIDSASPPTPD